MPDGLTPATDGSETHAPVGIRLAQVLHHGTDHRSQICTALTQLGAAHRVTARRTRETGYVMSPSPRHRVRP